jgi:hypothetical protein
MCRSRSQRTSSGGGTRPASDHVNSSGQHYVGSSCNWLSQQYLASTKNSAVSNLLCSNCWLLHSCLFSN